MASRSIGIDGWQRRHHRLGDGVGPETARKDGRKDGPERRPGDGSAETVTAPEQLQVRSAITAAELEQMRHWELGAGGYVTAGDDINVHKTEWRIVGL